ncbi:hypothetical protein FDP22_20070 (plasmid) [Paroceanicella profunda]|uniref:Uncharacterized protein n=1 Tax=Paroceanicella profunda TaxID=2579971 RepID=A0A5B8G259_9RHOB|nr:hypothetical protein [Paroceanicella profunda]QDL94154.1 hypothetical protein FDP22_20070 [Paroceanicella profunda]
MSPGRTVRLFLADGNPTGIAARPSAAPRHRARGTGGVAAPDRAVPPARRVFARTLPLGSPDPAVAILGRTKNGRTASLLKRVLRTLKEYQESMVEAVA